MKKILFLIILIILIGITSIYLYSESKIIDEAYYAIDTHYSFIYEEDRKYIIDIYSDSSNSIIEYKDNNIYQIIDNNDIYTLNNVDIIKTKINKYYVYQLSFNIFDIGKKELLIEKPILKIINQKFILNIDIGDIYILNPINYELLNINNYYASYSYLNESLMLSGINIEFNNQYNNIFSFNVGYFAKGRLDLALENNLLNNEIDIKKIIPNYQYNIINDDYLNLFSKTYFIPISYIDLKMIKNSFITLNIDNQNYYIDNFSYINNILDLDDYKNYIKEGKIEYV